MRNALQSILNQSFIHEVMIVSENEQLRIVVAQYFRMLSRIDRECKVAPNKTMLTIVQLNKALYGSPQVDFWVAAQKLIPKGLVEKIGKLYPELNNTEVKVCCLACIHADTSAMSIILNVKKITIYAANSHIRRKLGIEAHKSIKEAIEERISKICRCVQTVTMQ
jgi:hypothetical protein